MKNLIQDKLGKLSQEIEAITAERNWMLSRDKELSIRMDQIVGAVFELQDLLASLDCQPSATVSVEMENLLEKADQVPSAYSDQDIHQSQQEEIEKNNRQPS